MGLMRLGKKSTKKIMGRNSKINQPFLNQIISKVLKKLAFNGIILDKFI